jgi:2,3-bisphosphoglycerate-dependent phosphoglycerate mutase
VVLGHYACVKLDLQRPFTPPDGAQDVLLVRHGSVDAPEPGGLVGGRSDPSLNAAGLAQATALAGRLARERVGALFTTPLRRTGETAAPVAEAHGLAPVELPDLVEVYLGEWEGHGIARRAAAGDPEFVALMRGGRWDVVPGAEPREDFARRVAAGLERVADAAPTGGVAVAVTHSAVIDEVLCRITGSDPFAFMTCANGSITRVVRLPDRRWVLVAFNDTAHLTVD